MSDAVIGIAGSQKKQQTDATSARNSSKAWHKKMKVAGAVVAVVLCVLTWWKNLPDEILGVASATEQRNSVATIQPNVHETVAVWKRTESGEIPVGVWSETFHIKVGCKADYDAGVGKDFKVRYRFYSLEWKELQPGTWPATSEAQFMLLRPRTTVPIKVTCS